MQIDRETIRGRDAVERIVNTALNLFYAGCATRMYDDAGMEGGRPAPK